MYVRAGGAAGAAQKTDLGAASDALTDRNEISVEMPIAGGDAVAVVDLDDFAVIVAITGIGHGPRRGGVSRGHVRGAEILDGMEGAPAVYRMPAGPDRAGGLIAAQ